jgi:hypothetical protein
MVRASELISGVGDTRLVGKVAGRHPLNSPVVLSPLLQSMIARAGDSLQDRMRPKWSWLREVCPLNTASSFAC